MVDDIRAAKNKAKNLRLSSPEFGPLHLDPPQLSSASTNSSKKPTQYNNNTVLWRQSCFETKFFTMALKLQMHYLIIS